jgi:hypothetical protein
LDDAVNAELHNVTATYFAEFVLGAAGSFTILNGVFAAQVQFTDPGPRNG